VLWRDASHIQHDCTESTGLQQQIGDTQCLLEPRPGLCRAGRRGKAFGRLEGVRLNRLSFEPNPSLRFGATGSDGIASQQVADSIGQALCFRPRMRAKAATV
jgi:hypothetical protein